MLREEIAREQRVHIMLQLFPDVSTVLEQICVFNTKSYHGSDVCTRLFTAVLCHEKKNVGSIRGELVKYIICAPMQHSCHVAAEKNGGSQCTDVKTTATHTIQRRN